MKTITLSVDDMSFPNNQFFYWEKVREHYPGFKLSAFFIPADSNYFSLINEEGMKVARNMIRNAVAEGWLELIPHGMTHMREEFRNADYETMEIALLAYEEFFGEWDVPYIKGFKAPQWLISKEAVRCLDDYEWFLAVDRNQPDTHIAKRMYTYNWSIDQPFPTDEEQVKGHSHQTPPSLNNIVDCVTNVISIPPESKWLFISEIMKEKA